MATRQRKAPTRKPSTRKAATPKAPAKPKGESVDQNPDLEAGKAVAEANKEEQDSTLTTDDGRDIEALREERAKLIEEIADLEMQKQDRIQAEAEAAGLHEAKLDDAGAAEQQKAARDSGAELYDRLGILEGPPVVAPVLEELPGKFKIVDRREGQNWSKAVKEARFVGFILHLVGEDLPHPAEIIIDTRRRDGSDHQRFSAWCENGLIDVPLPGVTGAGDYVVHLEHLETRVGEADDERLPIVRESKPVEISLY